MIAGISEFSVFRHGNHKVIRKKGMVKPTAIKQHFNWHLLTLLAAKNIE